MSQHVCNTRGYFLADSGQRMRRHGGSRGGVPSTGMHANLVGVNSHMRCTYVSALLDMSNAAKCSEGAA